MVCEYSTSFASQSGSSSRGVDAARIGHGVEHHAADQAFLLTRRVRRSFLKFQRPGGRPRGGLQGDMGAMRPRFGRSLARPAVQATPANGASDRIEFCRARFNAARAIERATWGVQKWSGRPPSQSIMAVSQ